MKACCCELQRDRRDERRSIHRGTDEIVYITEIDSTVRDLKTLRSEMGCVSSPFSHDTVAECKIIEALRPHGRLRVHDLDLPVEAFDS